MSEVRQSTRIAMGATTFVVTLALVALTGLPVIVAIWVGIWAYAVWFGWHAPAGLPLFFWIAFNFFYPATSTAFTSLQEFATFNGALLVIVALASWSGARRARRDSRWFRLSVCVWMVWGLVAYLPVLAAWMLGTSGLAIPGPRLDNVLESSVLKTAIPVLFAWAPAACAAAAIRQPDDVARFVRAVLCVTLLVTVIAFLQAASGHMWLEMDASILEGRLTNLSTPSPNGYGRLLLMPTLVLLSAAFASRRPRGLWVALALAVVSIALTESRTTYFSLTLGVLVLMALNLRKRRAALVTVALAAIAVTAAFGLGVAAAFSEGSERRSFDNLEQRLALYEIVWNMVQESPWVGVRPGGYIEALKRSDYQRDRAEKTVASAHNMVLSIAAEWGVPMALALLAALAGTFWNGLAGLRRLRRARGAPGAAEARLLLAAAIAIAIAYLAHGLTEIVPPEFVFFAFGLSLAGRYALVPHAIAA